MNLKNRLISNENISWAYNSFIIKELILKIVQGTLTFQYQKYFKMLLKYLTIKFKFRILICQPNIGNKNYLYRFQIYLFYYFLCKFEQHSLRGYSCLET